MKPSNATILIVDDEPQNRKLLEALLLPEGYLTKCAGSGEEALAMAAAEAPDLILLDIMMPGMDGYQVAKILKAQPATANVPIIMVTAHIDRSSRLAGLDSGAEEFLSKPVDRAELWLRVRNLLRLKSYNNFLVNHSALLEQQVAERAAELLRFRSAMDATADGILLISRAGMRIVESNATASSLLGYTRAELLRIGPDSIEEADADDLAAQYDALMAGHGANVFVETTLRRADGAGLLVEMHRQVQQFGEDWIIVTVFRDITERKNAEQRLHHLAHFDPLTALPNRTLFYETLKKSLPQARLNNWLVGVLFIDLDYFKNVNDTLGHAIGDDLLRQFSSRLLQCVRVRDVVGRLGGDEFAIILIMPEGQQAAVTVANKIRDILRTPFDLSGHRVTLTASIGITIFPDDADDPQTLIKYADTAMYRAKQAGRDTYRFFTAQMNAEVLARLDLETALRHAVENEEFKLVYQPKVQLGSGRIAGLEALLRWQRPGHGMVSPQDFIPVLEETGLIVHVGRWVIQTACRQIARWIGGEVGPMQVSVNVSGRQFVGGDLEADVVGALQESAIPPALLELELTESSLMANTERTIVTLQSLKRRGVQISIDDFGTGYSSLAYLRRFPIDKLKIDIAFIRYVTTNPDDAAIVLAIISMAHSLKLEVVAEGVETEAQLSYLARHGCDQIQGFYFSRPLPLQEAEQLMLGHHTLPIPGVEPRSDRMTLLLVDDDAFILSSLQSVLNQDGYQILLAESAEEAFEQLAHHEVQVILCDQRMPGMEGTEFLSRVRVLYPACLRIVLSGASDLAGIMEAMNKGAVQRFYPKPWDSKVLRENIREAFRYYSVLHEEVRGVSQASG
jgi:diguanylate cyclase (GGDEF)-like protein/PAS domain S-box-containing protein